MPTACTPGLPSLGQTIILVRSTRRRSQQQVSALRAEPILASSRSNPHSLHPTRSAHPVVCVPKPLDTSLKFLPAVPYKTQSTNCSVYIDIRPHAARLTPDNRRALVDTAEDHSQQLLRPLLYSVHLRSWSEALGLLHRIST
jgi:hypothetical protein